MLNINIEKYNIPTKEYIIVGVSTGPDSMALFDLLQKKYKNIICCHVNHNIRKESDQEEEYLKKFCKNHNIIFECTKLSNYKKGSIENQARKKRYDFYETILKKYNSHFLFLAHHGDDLIETILMKISRGSNLDGYSGIKEIKSINNNNYTYKIIRPLIYYTKENIIEYNKDNNIKYFIDKTNFDDDYTRNRYRNHILPFLKNEDKNIHKKFLKYSLILKEYDDYITSNTNKIAREIINNNIIRINDFNKLDDFMKKNLLYYFWKTLNIQGKNINESHIKSIIKLAQGENKSINLPGNIIAEKSYNKLIFQKNNPKIESNSYKILLKDYNEIDNFIIEKITEEQTDGNNICRLNSDNIKMPLYLRNKKDGDKIIVLGMNKHKKIKEIFNENKVSNSLRDNYPLLVDGDDNIIWVPNLKKSKFNVKKEGFYDIILKCNEKEMNNE